MPWIEYLAIYVSDGSFKYKESDGSVFETGREPDNTSMIIENTKRYVWNDTTRCLEGYRVNTVISSNKKDNYPLTFIKTQPQMHIGIASVMFVLPHKNQWSLIDIYRLPVILVNIVNFKPTNVLDATRIMELTTIPVRLEVPSM